LTGTLFLIDGFTAGNLYALSGCPVLTSGGERFLVIYPSDWDMREGSEGVELVGPDGLTVARQGDEVAVRGYELGPSSFGCPSLQFKATEVLSVNESDP
jgi:hypothetical protein